MSNLDYYINKYKTFKNHQINLKSNFLIGVSGGLDSMALLDLSFISGLKFVAHVNYQLRGAENQQEIKQLKGIVKREILIL